VLAHERGGAEPVPRTPEEFSKHVDAEVTRCGKLVKESGAEIS
jgi:tripartite-type tricarboxylate transporter receptor subunit TctC